MPSEDPALSHLPAMMVLRPGDRVLVALNNEPEHDDAVLMYDLLVKSFPGVEFVVITDVESVTVQANLPTKRQQIAAAS